MSESTSGSYTDAASNFADDMSYRSDSATPTPTIPPISRRSSADVSMHSYQTCTPMDTSPMLEAVMGPPPPSHPLNTPTPSQSFFNMSPMPSSTYIPTATINPAMLNPSAAPMPSTFDLRNDFPPFSGSFNLSTDNFLPTYAPLGTLASRDPHLNSNPTFMPVHNTSSALNPPTNLSVSELRKAHVESQKSEQAHSSSHAEALLRETNLRNLLSFKDKQLTDLRHQQAQSSHAPSQDLLDLQSRLHALEQAKQDDAEAADVQYRELKERYDSDLEELQRAINVATNQQSHEASVSEQHLRTIERLNQQLQRVEAEASERYQELEKRFSSASQRWKVDEEKCHEDHEGVVSNLHNRIRELENAYTKLGSDAQSQRRALEDLHRDQMEAASQRWEQAHREDHERVVGELNDRIRELEKAYAKLGSDAQDQRRQLEDQCRNQSSTSALDNSHRQHIEDLEHRLLNLQQQHLHDLEEAKQRYDSLQDSTSRDRHILEDDWQKRLTDLENARHQDAQHEAEVTQEFQAQLKVQQDVLEDLQARISAMQAQHEKDGQDAETRLNEVQQELQEARQNLVDAERQIAQYQELETARHQTPTSTVDMARALETAISDAQRDAEVNFNAWKAAHEQGVQAEHNALREELRDLRTHYQSLQQTTATNGVNTNGTSSPTSGRRHGKQREREVLNVHSFANRRLYPPVATSRNGMGFSSPRAFNIQMPVSNIRSTAATQSLGFNSTRNASPGPSSRPTIASSPSGTPAMRMPANGTNLTSDTARPRTAAPPSFTLAGSHSGANTPLSSHQSTPTPGSRQATPSGPSGGATPTTGRPPTAPQQGTEPQPLNLETAMSALENRLMHALGNMVTGLAENLTRSNNTLPPKASRASGYSQTHEPKTRDPGRTRMMNLVRIKMRNMLHIEQDSEITNAIDRHEVAASAEEVATWEEGDHNPPPLHPLRPFWRHLNHEWNHELAIQFAEEFCREEGEFDVDEVKDHFASRLKTLHIYISRNSTYADGGEALLQAARGRSRRASRRGTLYDNRMRIIESNLQAGESAVWMLLHDMVRGLGLLGMSSDESDPDDNTSVSIIHKDWRSPEVIRLLQVIDRHRQVVNCYGNARAGAPPRSRRRHLGGPVSKHKPVAGLPRNWYNPIWYNSLSRSQLAGLATLAEVPLPLINEDD
ncbi:hypothetical protein PC9H_010153 [Pleurotus ostreatus]|uniref:Uncharacterized protein n=1 Tax=Pleurotus ostreatus TaxID=5322 RepID=A0A8H7DQA0_PLEOS|nr:uncharacterized protein PC9H_010153 [Pleurotus ostreatus]KAF7424842.1 hypothetical protein PC9H_010153 [Pleurotus ostreatus]